MIRQRLPILLLAHLLLICLSLATVFAADAPSIQVRLGNHPGYGRVVIDLPAHTAYHVTRDGEHVTIQFDSTAKIASAHGGTRNVLSVTGGDGKAELVVAPGATLHDQQYGNHVVIDVLDPAPASASSAGKAATLPKPPDPPALPPPQVAVQPPPAPTPPPKPAEIPPASAPQIAAATVPPPPAPPPQPATVIVPFNSPLGVAAFRRGPTAIVVFDQPIVLDLSALHDDPAFSTATAQTLHNATLLLVRLPPTAALSLSVIASAWRVSVISAEPHLHPIAAKASDGRLNLAAAEANTVVTVADPETGGTLLVGTQRHDGEGVPVMRHSVEFTLLPTWQGVAVAPASDGVTLRPTQDGFVVTAEPGGLALSPPSEIAEGAAHSVGLTHRFDFPIQPPATALRRLATLIVDDAMTRPLARGPRREAVARELIALGMSAEAQAILQMAAADEPAQADSPDNGALTGIAALLAHRPEEATGLDDARLADADDILLWRAYRDAALHPGSAVAAAKLTATLPLVLAYPPAMRDRMLPAIAETLVAGGQLGAAAELLNARKDDSSLALAGGLLQEAKGDTVVALATYDRLAQSADQRIHARAAIHAVELRLASGAIDAHEAADRLDKLLYAWRGDRHEEALRQRLAELRARTGGWRMALGLMRETETLFPNDKAELHAKLTDMFTAFLRGNGADDLPPLELVALVDENADLLPEGADGEALESRLADRLLALDLPQRAGPVLEKLMKVAPTGVGRATFGARLAAMRLREGDAQGALSALSASDTTDLSADLQERRTLLLADAQAHNGDAQHALSELEALNTAAADEARATILERAGNWPGAQKALTDYATKTVPPDGLLDDTQRRTLLRLATATARAGDEVALEALRGHELGRMGTGPLADMFRLLTADQVRGVADLKRSGQEAALAHALPAELKALQQGAAQTR